ncbi:protein TOO MANY MOUTHS [Lactuca sativa]|uniref:protein TOO MANY MOUTHS n=1 Tax=Lactuca sativa TaxID=4236 RepID=UPI001C6880F4|nr:protein TOO MANY MOUTHS [Lactuca sativa]
MHFSAHRISQLSMAFSFSRYAFGFLMFVVACFTIGNSQPMLNSVEQESVYRVLESLNSDVPWRSLFPDDLCSSAPHGVVCDYASVTGTLNIVELSFGYVSDFNSNPTCSPNSTLLDPFLFSSFPHLRKLFFYKCFTQQPVSLPDLSRVGSVLEELVFINNPTLFGSLSDNIGNMTSLRRLIITGTKVSGKIPVGFGELTNLEEATLSRNSLTGEIPENVSNLKKLKVLDLSQNGFSGNVPGTIGGLENLLKLDLSSNYFSGEIPETMKGLRVLEFLDLSDNGLVGGGVPLFLSEMSKLKGVYLSGNELGGVIPDIWKNLRGVNGIGLSRVGLVGGIPVSMGVFLGNLSYLGLDNNKLTGEVPKEFENLELLSELNLNNNNLSGKIPFSVGFMGKVGGKLRLEGNSELCVDEGVINSFYKVKIYNAVENPRSALVYGYGISSSRRVGDSTCCWALILVWVVVNLL